jgi:hypothetical protein|tara:strand:+ start:237 stop:473 length:237 start_codon:yes stop_codon:yes gene_type:complete
VAGIVSGIMHARGLRETRPKNQENAEYHSQDGGQNRRRFCRREIILRRGIVFEHNDYPPFMFDRKNLHRKKSQISNLK